MMGMKDRMMVKVIVIFTLLSKSKIEISKEAYGCWSAKIFKIDQDTMFLCSLSKFISTSDR